MLLECVGLQAMLMLLGLLQAERSDGQPAGVAPGKALPATGTCKHYAHSHRCCPGRCVLAVREEAGPSSSTPLECSCPRP